ncbi:2'-5' RNA ligase family protein [Paenibacillus sp. MCAF9]|uniref:2'-5' RNA ligase family protein n=1 Tax=Paenibacillus sp. MCAF9 TaxID=3233046 RepID=UPI003F9B0377
MQYFIGIIPPPEYLEKVFIFQKEWKNNGVVNMVEPHITLKAQGGLSPDLSWLDKLEKLCTNFPSFPITLSDPKFFGDYVLYLSVESQELYRLHSQIVQMINPSKELIKQYFELADFIPHLTLGKTYFGMNPNELEEMSVAARKALTPYPTFNVNQIRLYQEVEPLKYIPYKDITLKP